MMSSLNACWYRTPAEHLLNIGNSQHGQCIINFSIMLSKNVPSSWRICIHNMNYLQGKTPIVLFYHQKPLLRQISKYVLRIFLMYDEYKFQISQQSTLADKVQMAKIFLLILTNEMFGELQLEFGRMCSDNWKRLDYLSCHFFMFFFLLFFSKSDIQNQD